jgi:hypothetical protein
MGAQLGRLIGPQGCTGLPQLRAVSPPSGAAVRQIRPVMPFFNFLSRLNSSKKLLQSSKIHRNLYEIHKNIK